MTRSATTTPDAYIAALPDDRRAAVSRLRTVINANLPPGFEERIAHGMIAWCVPKATYPPGYHVDPRLPLLFLALGNTKGHIALHHMGLYGGCQLDWFTSAWAAADVGKLDMGKACVRFKKPERIPFELIGQLAARMTPEDWITAYERAIRR